MGSHTDFTPPIYTTASGGMNCSLSGGPSRCCILSAMPEIESISLPQTLRFVMWRIVCWSLRKSFTASTLPRPLVALRRNGLQKNSISIEAIWGPEANRLDIELDWDELLQP